tara:strand:+ start:190 stop:483 length:294 start_codon:yes stop_codon:yes gene_type:complete
LIIFIAVAISTTQTKIKRNCCRITENSNEFEKLKNFFIKGSSKNLSGLLMMDIKGITEPSKKISDILFTTIIPKRRNIWNLLCLGNNENISNAEFIK